MRLLLVGAGRSQVAALQRAHELGIELVAVDGDAAAPGLALAARAVVHDFSDVDGVVEIARAHRVVGVLTAASDRAVPVVAAVAERLGLPGIGSAVAHRMTHKLAMRAALAGAVPQPVLAGVASVSAAAAACDTVGLPLVVKPANSGGQRGVTLVEHRRELVPAVEEALAASPTGEAIMERYVPGRELNAIVVVREGVPTLVTLSDRLRPPGAGFGVGWIHAYPAELDRCERATAAAVVAAAVRALGLRDGIAFPQLIVGDDGSVVLVEIAARIAAGQMADLVRVATGVDLFEIAFLQALGRRVPDDLVTPRREQPVAIRFFTAEPGVLPAGRVAAIEGLDEVRAAPGVVQAELYFGVGGAIRRLRVDDDRRGYVLAVGATRAEALERSLAASMRLRVTVDAPPT